MSPAQVVISIGNQKHERHKPVGKPKTHLLKLAKAKDQGELNF